MALMAFEPYGNVEIIHGRPHRRFMDNSQDEFPLSVSRVLSQSVFKMKVEQHIRKPSGGFGLFQKARLQ